MCRLSNATQHRHFSFRWAGFPRFPQPASPSRTYRDRACWTDGKSPWLGPRKQLPEPRQERKIGPGRWRSPFLDFMLSLQIFLQISHAGKRVFREDAPSYIIIRLKHVRLVYPRPNKSFNADKVCGMCQIKLLPRLQTSLIKHPNIGCSEY